jgi:transposase InsO family protein
VRRQFTAVAPDVLWRGDLTEVQTEEGKLYLATVLGDLFSRRMLGHAAAEAFNSTIKVEYIHRHHFHTRAEARLKIATWIVDFYNTRRRHSACQGMSPINYERYMAEARGAEAA